MDLTPLPGKDATLRLPNLAKTFISLGIVLGLLGSQPKNQRKTLELISVLFTFLGFS